MAGLEGMEPRRCGKVLVIGEGDVVLDDLPHGVERVGATVGTGQGGLEGALVSNLGGGCIVRSRPALEGIARAGEAAGRRTGGGAIGGCIRRRGGVGDGHGRAGATAIVIGNGEGNVFSNFLLDNFERRKNAGKVSRTVTGLAAEMEHSFKNIRNFHSIGNRRVTLKTTAMCYELSTQILVVQSITSRNLNFTQILCTTRIGCRIINSVHVHNIHGNSCKFRKNRI